MPTVNHRLSRRERDARDVERSKPPVRRRKDILLAERRLRTKRWLGVVVLAPMGLITLVTLLEVVLRAHARVPVWRTDPFFFSVTGAFAWLLAHYLGWRPIRAYVFGHEFTHLLVAKAFGGVIFDWDYTVDGGFVETNKSNTWISLSPYLIPFYTVVVLLLGGVASLWLDLGMLHQVELAGRIIDFRPIWLLYALVGFSWCFHFTFTVETVKMEQGDLKRNGEFFSMMLIFLFNIATVFTLLVAALPGMSFSEVGRCWMGVASGFWHGLVSLWA